MSGVHTEHIEYLLSDYVTGKLDEPLRSGVESHLAECAECRVEHEILQDAFRVIAESTVQGPSRAYFAGVLPRVRDRLEQTESLSLFTRSFVTRFALPLAAGVLAIVVLLHLRAPSYDAESAHNPLRPVLQGVGSEELAEIALEQMHRQSFPNSLGENETSALLAAPLLTGRDFFPDAESLALSEDPVLGEAVSDELEQLSDADLDVLVARLSERISP